MSFDITTFFAVIASLILTGLVKNWKVQSEESYLFAERRCGLFGLTSTLVMTELNPSTLLAFSGLGYLVGLKALFLPFIFLIGLLFYALTVAKKYHSQNISSITTLFKERYGSFVAKIASFSLLFAMMGFTATYVKSITLIFSPLFPSMNLWILSGTLTFFILLITLRGGLVAIIRTDVFSFLLVLSLFPLFLIFTKGHAVEPLPSLPHLLPNRFIISLVVLTMFTYILAPWYGQKIFSAKNEKTAFTATLLAALFVFLLYGIATLSTTYLRASGTLLSSPDLAIPTIINQYFPFGLRGMAYATLFMITSTTLAGVWSAMSSMMITDFLKPSSSYKQGLAITFLLAFSSYLLGNGLVDKILNKLVLANIPVAALSFALLAGLYWKKVTPLGALLSILTGLAWGLFTYLHFGDEGLYTWYWALYGIPLIFLTGTLGSLIPNKKVVAGIEKTELNL